MEHKRERRWRIRTVCCCFLLAAALLGVCTTADSVLYSALAQQMGAARSKVSTGAALALAVLALASPLAVRLAERTPLRFLTALGGLLAAGALAGLSCVRSVPGMYALFFLRGLGCACFSVPIITSVVAAWFVHRRGLATGLVMSASGAAGALVSPLLAFAAHAAGYPAARLVQAGLALLLTAPGSLLFLHAAPEEVGVRALLSRSEERAAQRTGGPGLRGRPGVYALLLVFSAAATALNQLVLHFSGYAESLGLSSATGAAMVSAAMAGSVVSKALAGALCDRLGAVRANLVILGAGGAGLAVLCCAPGAGGVLYAAAALYGMVYSLQTVGLPQLTAQLARPEEYGRAFARVSAVSGCLSAGTVSAWGWLYERTGGYGAALGLCMGLLLMAAAVLPAMARAAQRSQRTLLASCQLPSASDQCSCTSPTSSGADQE